MLLLILRNYNCMQTSTQQFIQLCLENQVLKFGEFTLKSGRHSHYFFNAGQFYKNTAIIKLSEFYADLIYNHIITKHINFDCLFGPAYKGIPLVIATAIALENKYNFKTTIAFNRKEKKQHGEGGDIIGDNLNNKKVILIDDVISAGTATKESISILNNYNAKITGIVVALNRQEPANNHAFKTAAEEISTEFNIPIFSITTLLDIIAFTKQNPEYKKYAELLTQDHK
jgi:orotate phosphoribosyltransferase